MFIKGLASLITARGGTHAPRVPRRGIPIGVLSAIKLQNHDG